MRPYEHGHIRHRGRRGRGQRRPGPGASRRSKAKGGRTPAGSSVGSADLRLRDPPQARGLLRGHRADRRARRPSADMERIFVLADEVVRHKIIRLPDKVAGRRAAAATAAASGGEG